MARNTQTPQKNRGFMSEYHASCICGGFTLTGGTEVFLFHEVALPLIDPSATSLIFFGQGKKFL